MTTNSNEKFLQVPDSAAFYIRTALDRAIRQVKREIVKNQNFLIKLTSMATSDKPDIPADYLEEMTATAKFIISHNQQWLREAEAEFAKLPNELRPPKED